MIKDDDLIDNYIITDTGNVINRKTNRILKQDKSTGYSSVVLSNNGKKKKFSVHRLVAFKYIENTDNKPCVNHINGEKYDNRVENLEWCTYSENEKHSHSILCKRICHSAETKNKIGNANRGIARSSELKERWSNSRKGMPAKNKLAVVLNGNRIFESLTIASLETGISVSSISNNIKNRSKKTKVGTWECLKTN